jgi:hypothetical protein
VVDLLSKGAASEPFVSDRLPRKPTPRDQKGDWMSDDLKDDFPGATKGLFASVGVTLLLVGGDMIAEKEGLRVGLGLFLVLIGCGFFYAAAFWSSAKKVLSDDAQRAIGRFSESPITWTALIFLLFQIIIMSRFIEERRWPFSYPAGPEVAQENNDLKNQLNHKNADIAQEKELADKWRFATILRRRGSCGYQLRITGHAASTVGFWNELLQYGGWNERAGGTTLAPAPGAVSSGITLRIKGETGISAQCAGILQGALTDLYPSTSSKISNNQQSDFLSECPDCVQIEIDY